ncbi:hypothetical protein K456DRAFT_59665 [Colletotrichum gloeosporioides 23]|nr:hypothetical protein K456DRAFT_59665 [Colletotrichum gloeosporioides 23]
MSSILDAKTTGNLQHCTNFLTHFSTFPTMDHLLTPTATELRIITVPLLKPESQ